MHLFMSETKILLDVHMVSLQTTEAASAYVPKDVLFVFVGNCLFSILDMLQEIGHFNSQYSSIEFRPLFFIFYFLVLATKKNQNVVYI